MSSQIENFPMSLGNFINYTPKNIDQYRAMGVSIVVNITGVKETQANIKDLESTPDLFAYLQNAAEQLDMIMYNTAPVDTGRYRDSTRVDFDESTGESEVTVHNVPYAKFLLYGAKTLYHAAAYQNRKGIKWPYRRVEGNLGILHDVRRILYAWEHQFDIGLDDVDFAQPRTRLGHFSEGTW